MKDPRDNRDHDDDDPRHYRNNNNHHNNHHKYKPLLVGTDMDSPSDSQATLMTEDTALTTSTRTPQTPLLQPQQLERSRFAEIIARDNNFAYPHSNNNNNRQGSHLIRAATASLQRHFYAQLLARPQQSIFALASASTASLIAFLVLVLPGPALFALCLFVSLTCATLVALRHRVLDWWNHTVLPRGLGHYVLPESTMRLLTQESIHTFMTDDTFFLENRHLLLYFLQLPPPQLERYVMRLAPRHRERLLRPGLGHLLLSPDTMRLIVGQQQQEEWNNNTNNQETGATATAAQEQQLHVLQRQQQRLQQPALEVIVEQASTPRMSSRRLDVDDDDTTTSDLGIDMSPDDFVGGLASEEQARRFATIVGLSNSNNGGVEQEEPQQQQLQDELGEENLPSAVAVVDHNRDADDSHSVDDAESCSLVHHQRAEEYAEEELVLTQAFFNALYDGIWTPVSRYMVNAAEETTGPVTARLVTYGLGISAVSTVLGLLLGMAGYRRGIYRRPTLVLQQAYPRENTLYTTVLIGLAGTGVTLLAHWQLSRGKGRKYFYSQFRRSSRKA